MLLIFLLLFDGSLSLQHKDHGFHRLMSTVEKTRTYGKANITSLTHQTIFKKCGTVFTNLAYGHLVVPLYINQFLINRQEMLNLLDEGMNNITIPPEVTGSAKYHLNWLANMTHVETTNMNILVESTLNMFNNFEAERERREVSNVSSKREERRRSRRRREQIEAAAAVAISNKTIHAHIVKKKKKKRRKKRQLIAAGIMGVVGGFASSLLSNFKNEELLSIVQQDVSVLQTQVSENIVTSQQNKQDIKKLNSTVTAVLKELGKMVFTERITSTQSMVLETSYVIQSTLTMVRRFLDAIETIIGGKFSIDIATPSALSKGVETLKKEAIKDGRIMAIKTLMDLSLLPASWVYDKKKKIMFCICHIPFHKAGSGDSLDLFHFVGTPIRLSNNSQLFAQIGNLPEPFLAISSDTSHYLALSTENLEDCSKVSSQYYCPNMALSKRKRKSCLLSLYDNDISEIQKICPLTVSNQISEAYKVESNVYIWTETEPKELTVKCPHQIRYTEKVSGVFRIELASGCAAFTDTISIANPRFEPSVTVPGLVMSSPLDVKKWFDYDIPEEVYLESAEELIRQVGVKVPLSSIHQLAVFKKKMAEIKPQISWFEFLTSLGPGGFISHIVTFVVVSVVLVVTVKVGSCLLPYCWKRTPKVRKGFSSLGKRDDTTKNNFYGNDEEETFAMNEIQDVASGEVVAGSSSSTVQCTQPPHEPKKQNFMRECANEFDKKNKKKASD